MKFNTSVSVAIVAALAAQVSAAPATSNESQISKRDIQRAEVLISRMDDHTAARQLYSASELAQRDYAIVTEILTYINQTGLAPEIIKGLVDDPTLGPLVSNAVVAIVKSGLINLTTLLQALDQSGLAANVITALINDCQFYATIYKIALSYIGNLASQIGKILGLNLKREELDALAFQGTPTVNALERRASATPTGDSNSVVINLLESLKNSGLAASVVKSLITDQGFLTWGANLISELFSSGAITLPELITALEDSGIVADLFKQFFTISTLESVIVNGLAAAFGQCGGSSLVTATASTTKGGSTPTGPGTGTGTGPANCKRRRRSYNY